MVAHSATAATLQVAVPADAPTSADLVASTDLGQAMAPVTIAAQARLLTVATAQPLVQAETAISCGVTITAQALGDPTGASVTAASGVATGIGAKISAVARPDATNVSITLTVTVPGSPRPFDWDPSQPGSPLKPPPPARATHGQLPLVITIATANGSYSTASLSPGLTLTTLDWDRNE